MRKLALLVLILTNSVTAAELVCEGFPPKDSSQRLIFIDCDSRKEVVDILRSAWMTLRREGIGGYSEDLCWQPYETAREIHPSVNMGSTGLARSFLDQCNMSLKYIK